MGYGTVSFSCKALSEWFGEGTEHRYRVVEGIPEGAEVVGVRFSPMLQRVVIALRHPNLTSAWHEDLASINNIPLIMELLP